MKKFAALVAVLALVAFAAPAFAANPFMDVPMNHWAYDAVSQLASRGVVSGYPDGAFKGEWKATRYEMASVVARALAYVDMNKASKQDLELLKKLVVEFKDELDALGVKVDELDSRVAVLEEGVGGWYFSGNFRFTAKWSESEGPWYDEYDNLWGVDQDTNWSVDRFRWNIKKVVDDKVTLNVRLQGGGGSALAVNRAYAAVKFPWDVTMKVGRFPIDWEGAFYATDFAGYMMNDAFVTDFDPLSTAAHFYKPFGMGSFELFFAHEEDFLDFFGDLSDSYIWGARLGFDFNEQFHMAVNYVRHDMFLSDLDVGTIWGDLIVNFTPGIAFKGQYFMQDLDDEWAEWDDSPSAWKAVLDVDQDVLGGFTSLWLEYAQIDQNFLFMNADPYAWAASASGFGIFKEFFDIPVNLAVDDTTVLNIVAKQQWNDQWWTYVRYIDFDSDVDEIDYTGWTASVRYNYTPNLWFEVGYDKIDNDVVDYEGLNDNMVWFRTTVNF